MRDKLLKILKRTLAGLLTLVATVLFVFLLLVGTEAGSAWVIRKGLDQVAGSSDWLIDAENISGTLTGNLLFQDVAVSDALGNTVVAVDSITLQWQPLALFSHAVNVNLLELENVRVALPPSEDESPEPLDLDAVLSPLFALPVTVQVDQFQVAQARIAGQTPITLDSLSAALALDNAGLTVNAMVQADADTAVTADVDLQSGSYALTGRASWEAAPGGMPASGEISLNGDLAELSVAHTLSAPAMVFSEGTVVTGLMNGGMLSFDLRHVFDDVRGEPFNAPQLETASGSITTSGTPDNIDLGLDATLSVTGLGQVQSNATANVANNDGNNVLTLQQLSLQGRQFNFSSNGEVNLSDPLMLRMDWELADFADGDVLDAVELSNINSSGSVTLTGTGEAMNAAVTITDLEGQLNGYPLTGSGNVSLAGGAVEEISLALGSDANSLMLNGSVTPALDLAWALEAPALDRVVTNLSGHVSGSGTLTGTPELPRINGMLSAGDIGYRSGTTTFGLDSATADAVYEGGENEVLLDFTRLELITPNQAMRQDVGEVAFRGRPEAHTVRIETESPDLALQGAAEGGLSDGVWEGVVSNAAVRSLFGNWQLQNALMLSLSGSEADVASHCWQMNALSVCGQAQWQADAGATGSVTVDNFPLLWLNSPEALDAVGSEDMLAVQAEKPSGLERLQQQFAIYLPENGLLDGTLDLDADFTGLGGTWEQAMLTAELAPRNLQLGIIRLPPPDSATTEPEVENYGIDEISLTVDRRDNRWLVDSGFEIYLPEAGGLDFQGVFNGELTLTDDESLGGEFEFSFNNIAWIEALVPNLRNVNGEFGATGSVGGNLERPLLMLDASLQNGSFEVPEYGLSLQAVEVSLVSANDNEIAITGSAESGQGSISLESDIMTPLLATRSMRAQISGQNFLAVNRPDMRVVTNPDLVLDFRDNALDVSGSLEVPEMLLDLSENQALTGAGSVNVSRDAVIVATPPDQQQDAANAVAMIKRIPVSANIMLTLGDDVQFLGFGLDLMLAGSLQLEQTASRPMLAHGELTIPVGSYELYGQRLTIDGGRLLFLGNPMNPALDIRAVRETRTAVVGLQMNGTVSNIQAQLFSTPALPESEVLSLLVTGNSFQSAGNAGEQSGENMLGAIALLSLEKGQGLTSSVQNKLGLDTLAIDSGDNFRDSALGLGKYISPNLFMRYDIGLFDRENVLSLDYILTERLRLEVESGVSQSIDLTYTVEK